MQRITVLTLGMLLAAASLAPRLTSQTPATPPVGSAQTPQTTEAPVVSGRADLQAPLDKVWAALPAAYASLSIPITVNEPANRVIGTEGMRTHHYLGDARLSKFLNCGEIEGTLNADTYDVNLSMLTQLQPNAAGGTTVTTKVDAAAKPGSTAGQYNGCISTGQLETRLVRFIESQLR
ncbi:MAG: hypothetical protein ACREMS_11235 [Gemmatimonadaceae bacterium]